MPPNASLYAPFRLSLSRGKFRTQLGDEKTPAFFEVNLSAGRTAVYKATLDEIVREGRLERDPTDGLVYAPCTSKWTVGAEVDGDQLEIPLLVDQVSAPNSRPFILVCRLAATTAGCVPCEWRRRSATRSAPTSSLPTASTSNSTRRTRARSSGRIFCTSWPFRSAFEREKRE